jgi:hypothetical protein
MKWVSGEMKWVSGETGNYKNIKRVEAITIK